MKKKILGMRNIHNSFLVLNFYNIFRFLNFNLSQLDILYKMSINWAWNNAIDFCLFVFIFGKSFKLVMHFFTRKNNSASCFVFENKHHNFSSCHYRQQICTCAGFFFFTFTSCPGIMAGYMTLK